MGQIIDFNFFLKTQPVKKYHLYIFLSPMQGKDA